jgi:hypothetical protein
MEADRVKPSEVRRALRLRRQELRRDLATMRQQARARARSMRAARKPGRRRRLLALPLLLLLLLLIRCPADPEPPPVATVEPKAPPKPAPEKPPVPSSARKSTRPPLAGHLGNRPRAPYQASAPLPPAWIDELRLQAAARSPRLAACFDGTARPGALRWNAALNPDTGTVSDHDLEPLGPRSALTPEQRTCVVQALSSPRYRLTPPPTQPFPERVTLVIEF